MPDQLLTILQGCFLVLLYLFFLRVLRAVWTEVQRPAAVERAVDNTVVATRSPVATVSATPSGPASPAPQSRVSATALRATAPAELAGTTYPIRSGMVLGRSTDADVVLDDKFISGRHLALHVGPGGTQIEDLGSTNGTSLNGVPLVGSTSLWVADRIELGGIELVAE